MNRILNIRKPVGWTSFDAVRYFKRHTPIKKIGHAGALDPFADGVLLICLGQATKRIEDLMSLEKEYIADVEFGTETDTLDISGTIVKKKRVPKLEIEQLEKVNERFTGNINQIPPNFSAIKVNGKRSYQYAREGKTVQLKPKKVTIHKIQIVKLVGNLLTIQITCSRGTYIRSLARDYSKALETVGFLRSLTRTRIGQFNLSSSVDITQSIKLFD